MDRNLVRRADGPPMEAAIILWNTRYLAHAVAPCVKPKRFRTGCLPISPHSAGSI